MKLNYIKEDLYRVLNGGKTVREASLMFCNPNHPLMKDFWDVNCPRRGFVISLYNNPFYKEIDSKADYELNKLAQKARDKYLSISGNQEINIISINLEVWKECVDQVFNRDEWDIFFQFYSQFGREVLEEISYLREERNHDKIVYEYQAKDCPFKILYGSFRMTCEYYIEQCQDNIEMAKEKIIERLFDDMNSQALDEIESIIKKCNTPSQKIQFINQILEEKNVISERPLDNRRIINDYINKRNSITN
jgi:hypothetical protein